MLQEVYKPNQSFGSLDRTVLVASPITARKIVGSSFQETKNLTLADVPIYTVAIPISETTTEFMACLDVAMTRSTMYDFLVGACPNKEQRPDYDGVIADWILPQKKTPPKPETEEKETYYNKLNRLHEGLKEHWVEFERNRPLWLAIMGGQDHLPDRFTNGPFRSLGQVSAEYGREGANMSAAKLRRFFAAESLGDGADALAQFIRSTPKAQRIPKIQRMSTAKVLNTFTHFGIKDRAKYLKQALDESSWETRIKFAQAYAENVFDRVNMTDGEGQPHEVYIRKDYVGDNENLNETPDRLGRRVINYDSYYIEAAPVVTEEGSVEYRLDYSTLRWKDAIKPFLHWKTILEPNNPSQTKREWILDYVPGHQLPELMRDLSEKDFKRDDNAHRLRFSPLAGMLTVAYFSPEIVESWPQHVGLPDSDSQNVMGPAQVPVLASIRRNDLARSVFISTLEEHSKQAA